jgi:hypothetical protein
MSYRQGKYIGGQETTSQTRVHASKGPVLCKCFDCKNEFVPKRGNQVFCSSKCRLNYFATARKIGIILLERINCNPTLRILVDKFLRDNDGRTFKQ